MRLDSPAILCGIPYKRNSEDKMRKNKKSNGPKAKPRSGVPAAYKMSPKMSRLPNSTVLKNREYIGQCTGNLTWGVEYDLRINPGDATAFPWLSAIASRYEVYRFRKLKLIYESGAPTSYGGSIMVGVDPDVLDLTPANKTEMMTMKWVKRCNTWDSMEYNIPFSEEIMPDRVRYVAPAIPFGADAKTYDIGMLVVASDQTATGYYLGELYLEYEVELALPCLHAEALVAQSNAVFTTTACTPTHPITAGPYLQSGLMEVRARGSGGIGDDIWLPEPGVYFLNWAIEGTGITNAIPNFSGVNTELEGSSGHIAADGTGGMGFQIIKSLAKSSYFMADWNALATTLTHVVLTVMRYYVDDTHKLMLGDGLHHKVARRSHSAMPGVAPMLVRIVGPAPKDDGPDLPVEALPKCPEGWEYVRK